MRNMFLTCSMMFIALLFGCKGGDSPRVTPGMAGEVLERDPVIPGTPSPSGSGAATEDAGRNIQAAGRAMDREIPQ